MSSSVPEPRAVRVSCTPEFIRIEVEDGRVLLVPTVWFPRLAKATPEQLANCELVGPGLGIHWDDLDEDLGVASLFAANASRIRPPAKV